MCFISPSRYVYTTILFIPYLDSIHPLQDFGQAGAQFERILAMDPNRIDDIDVFSNILYVTDSRLKLSRLAHEFLALEKDRPEICCLIGGLLNISAFVRFLSSSRMTRKSLFSSGRA